MTTTTTSNPQSVRGGPSRGERVVGFALRYGIQIVFLILCVAVALTTPVFLTISNLSNVLLQSASVGIIAVGMTFVIIVRGIDVSVGGIVALSSAIGAIAMTTHGQSALVGILLIVFVGAVFGAVNGASVAWLGMPAFLVTLATVTMARGLVLSISEGKSIFGLPDTFSRLGLGSFLGVPYPVIVMFLVFAIGWALLSTTVFGRKVYAVGGNPEAAEVSGISVKRVVFWAFVIAGVCSGISSVMLTARFDAFTASMGLGFEFSAIAAVVIGGTSLFGGKGTMAGTLAGVLLIGVINNALNLLSVSAFYQDVVRGLIIFVAVLLDAVRTRYATRLMT